MHDETKPVKILLACPAGPLFDAARSVVGTLHRAGFDAYFVGGAARDICRHALPHDVDIVTVATPGEVKKLFPDCEAVGECFGVTLVKAGGYVFEVATAREERGYTDGRRPDEVRYTRDIALDVQRRDFTVNALLFDPERGELTDFVGGLEDLRQGTLRCVGEAMCRFNEDYLRMLRAVRFAAKLGFELDPATFEAIRALAGKVALLAPERVRAELELMLTGPAPVRALELLKACGLLAVLLPEVEALSGVSQHPKYHPEGDVWEHTLKLFRLLEAPPEAGLAWSILLHDIGKVPARTVDADGIPHFFSHESIGAEMADKVAERLRFSNEMREVVVHAVRNHMRFASVRNMREAKIKRLMAEPNFAMELELHRVDCLGSNGMLEGYEFLKKRFAAMPVTQKLPPPLVTGSDLIAAGYVPGPRFKEMLDTAMDEQLEGLLHDRSEAMEFLRQRFPMTAKRGASNQN